MFLILCVFGYTSFVNSIDILPTLSKPQHCAERDDCGTAVYLTPYVKANLLSEARRVSKVESFLPKEWQIKSHAGFVTVNEKLDSHLFFWLFPSMKNPKTAPLVLWLEGRPGTSSCLNMFFRNGPYVVSECQCECEPMSLSPAFYHWSEIMHVLYIDSPVGTGFSFTSNSSGLAETADDVVKDLYTAVHQIFQIFPEYQTTEFFIVGESYSAKYAPLLAYLISSKITADVKINLKGIAIGNGWLDPLNMLGYSGVLFNIGLIDSNTRDDFGALENIIASLISNESQSTETYSEAFDLLQSYFPVEPSVDVSIIENATGLSYFGNYIKNGNSAEDNYVVKVKEFLNQPRIRRKLHVGSKSFTVFNEEVFGRLKFDLLRSVGPEFGAVMDNYRVLMYNGQLDITCAYHLTTKILRNMKWEGAELYKKAPRRKWYVEGKLAGYVKSAGNFTEVLVRDAGLRVAEDRPLWAWDLIKKFTQNLPFA